MDDFFHVIDDIQIVLRSRGVYRQSKVYQRHGRLYAGLGSGFVVLLQSGGTSCPNVSWEANDELNQIMIAAGCAHLTYKAHKTLSVAK
jgi:hypothetical protein